MELARDRRCMAAGQLERGAGGAGERRWGQAALVGGGGTGESLGKKLFFTVLDRKRTGIARIRTKLEGIDGKKMGKR
jgi:hypothetical protein